MVAPGAVDEKVVPRESLFLEAESLEQAAAALVLGAEVGHDAMQAQHVEHERVGGPQRLGHQPLPLVRPRDLVAEMARLEGAAHDVRVVARAQTRGRPRAPRGAAARSGRRDRPRNRRRRSRGVRAQKASVKKSGDGRGRPAIEVAGEVLLEEARHRGLHAGAREANREAHGLQLGQQPESLTRGRR